MRTLQSSAITATMKFVTYVRLIICAVQVSMTVQQQNERTSSIAFTEIPVKAFHDIDIGAYQIEIPENSWWKGIKSRTARPRYSWPFDSIEYQKDIPQDSKIKLDYTVQYAKPGFIWNSWVNLCHDSVFLCDKTENTQDASIIALVRELLGISERCPVSAGHMANTSGIDFPLKKKSLYLNSDVSTNNIRILVNMWNNEKNHVEKLFTGQFHIVDHEPLVYSLIDI